MHYGNRERFEIVLNGVTREVKIVPTDEKLVYSIQVEGLDDSPIGKVRRESRNKQSGKFIARHKITGRETGGVSRKEAVISLIYSHYKEK